jgi:hypothetical protein
MKMTHKMRAAAAALAMGLAACGGGGSGASGSPSDDVQTFTEPCVMTNGLLVATHDFGTMDPAVLGRVTALETGGPCGVGAYEEVSVLFVGGVAHVSCLDCAGGSESNAATSVTFVLH